MKKFIFISEDDLKRLVKDTANEIVDSVTKKIAESVAKYSYNNEVFTSVKHNNESHYSAACGLDDDDDDFYGSSCGTYGKMNSKSKKDNIVYGCGNSGGC